MLPGGMESQSCGAKVCLVLLLCSESCPGDVCRSPGGLCELLRVAPKPVGFVWRHAGFVLSGCAFGSRAFSSRAAVRSSQQSWLAEQSAVALLYAGSPLLHSAPTLCPLPEQGSLLACFSPGFYAHSHICLSSTLGEALYCCTAPFCLLYTVTAALLSKCIRNCSGWGILETREAFW